MEAEKDVDRGICLARSCWYTTLPYCIYCYDRVDRNVFLGENTPIVKADNPPSETSIESNKVVK